MIIISFMGLLLDTFNCESRMRRECRECFPRHRFIDITYVNNAWKFSRNVTAGFNCLEWISISIPYFNRHVNIHAGIKVHPC